MKTGEERRARLRSAVLYLCTDGRSAAGGERLDAVLEAGVDVVQLRDKTSDARALLEAARRMRQACDRHGALFVVNDRPDVALAAEADGVHLGQDDLPPRFVREAFGPDLLVGRSTHGRADLERAAGEDADYVAVGPVFETPTKPGRPAAGLEFVREAARIAPMPWFAIGGIDVSTLPGVLAAGARRIVVVRAIEAAPDPVAATRGLREALGERDKPS